MSIKYFILNAESRLASFSDKVHRKVTNNRYDNEYRKKSPNVLTSEQKAQIREFYAPYKRVKYWSHDFYTAKTGEFSPMYLPHGFYFSHVAPYFNDFHKAVYFDNKCCYDKMFPTIPQAECVLKRMNGFWFDSQGSIISEEDVRGISVPGERVFLKAATDTYGGHGVRCLEGTDLGSQILRIAGKNKYDIVIQMPLHQHPALAAINSSSVNSIRVFTLLKKNGEVKVCSCALRMGVNGSVVDNVSSGGLLCGITEDGHLREFAYDSSGEKVNSHPSSGVVFLNYEIPSFQNILATAKRAHLMMPDFRLIAWDFTVTEDGTPTMIEMNFKGGLAIQLTNGPLFGEDTTEILNEVFGR